MCIILDAKDVTKKSIMKVSMRTYAKSTATENGHGNESTYTHLLYYANNRNHYIQKRDIIVL